MSIVDWKIMSIYSKEQIFPGLWVYKNVFKEDLNLINRVEDLLKNNSSNFKWSNATVGYMEEKKDYRDCVDFKIGEVKDKSLLINPNFQTLQDIWKDAYLAQIDAVNDYCGMYNSKMDYWEVMNFIKYGPGQHFQEHADHGYSYSATISLVGYPNSDYSGGGLRFPKLGIEVQPESGDLYIFPSTYLFSHVALPVQEGIKYSIVTMLDYNDHAHNDEFMQMREKWIRDAQNKSF